MKYIAPLLLLFPLFVFSQIVPSAQLSNWPTAGLETPVMNFTTIIDVTTLGAIPNDSIDDYAAIDSAITLLSGTSGVIYFPAGNYLIQSTVDVKDSIIIRGAGADSTTLTFNFNGNAANSFHIGRGLTEPFYTLTGGYTKNSNLVTAANAVSFLAAGDNIEIRQQNGAWDIQPANWAEYSVGHFARVNFVSGDSIWLSEPLRISLSQALNPEIRKVTPRRLIGFECFKIIRTDNNSNGINYGFDFANASNCWLRGVESERSICSHVAIDRCSHISITGCYFHDAYLYDGTSTRGYGVTVLGHTTSCLIEDNVFRNLRHAMIAKQGANGNVFAYNYSSEPRRSEPIPDYAADICLHGHYAFANLFEGNIAQNLQIDIVWGPSGPYNTFLRNRIELYGIIMSSGSVQSDSQLFAGNTVTNTAGLMGNYILTGTGHYQYGNNIKGTATPTGTTQLTDTSYYLKTIPPFFWNIPQHLPATGYPNTLQDGINPALKRYTDGGLITRCGYLPYIDTTSTDTTIHVSILATGNDLFSVHQCSYHNRQLQLNITSKQGANITAGLYAITGQLITQTTLYTNPGANAITAPCPHIPAGMYLLRLSSNGTAVTKKILIQ